MKDELDDRELLAAIDDLEQDLPRIEALGPAYADAVARSRAVIKAGRAALEWGAAVDEVGQVLESQLTNPAGALH